MPEYGGIFGKLRSVQDVLTNKVTGVPVEIL
jgi:hypothetical protein